MELELTIDRLGGRGDGVATGPEGTVFVPFALPGETVRVALQPGSDRGALIKVLAPSPERVDPGCPHFGSCGGCALQHLRSEAYFAWKGKSWLRLAVARPRGRSRSGQAHATRQPA